MKPLFRILLVALLAAFGPLQAAAQTVTPADASAYVGRVATVDGMVSQVSVDNRSGNTFINFGGRYPNHVFYAVIFHRDAGQFPDILQIEGRTVAVSGTIELYRGKPQIILSNPAQLTLR